MRRKILVIASAMILAAQLGSPVAAEQPSTEQLTAIAGYLEANDVQGLRAYLDAYPELAEGTTPLATLLRRFLVESMAGNDYFRFRSDLSDAIGGNDDGNDRNDRNDNRNGGDDDNDGGPQPGPTGPGY
jgi:hypothetical protein